MSTQVHDEPVVNQSTNPVDLAPRPAAEPARPSMLAAATGSLGSAAVQRKLAQRMVQRRGSGQGEAETVHKAAADGVSGASQSLPHMDRIQASFGRHDVGHIQAHVGGPATEASERMGASAYAAGDKVAFASSAPDLHTAAHEAAHVIQQQGGVSLKGGVGEAGDAHERHADAVADAVVAGHSAEHLLDGYGGGAQAQGAGPVQRKETTQAATQSAGDDHTLTITKGELTATGEGSDAATKYIHWPNTDASGVTLGKGYDIGSRSAQQVIDELTAAGMSADQATKISKGAGLKGSAAGKFVTDNKKDVGEIARDVQYALLATMLTEYTEKARHTATDTKADSGNRNAAGREKAEGKAAGTYVMSADQWSHLHPAMVELLTDLIYQGGYYGYDRVAKINAALKAHDGNHLEQFKAVRELFSGDYMDNYAGKIGEGKGGKGSKETFYGQQVSLEGEYRRNQIRLAYLNHVITALESGKEVVVSTGGAGATNSGGSAGGKGQTQAPQLPAGGQQAGGNPAGQNTGGEKPSGVVGHATTKVGVNVRATASLDGKKIGLLPAGSQVDVLGTTNDGWLKISYQGKTAYITGMEKYVAYKPAAPAASTGTAAAKTSAGAAPSGGGGGGLMQSITEGASQMWSSVVSTVEDAVESVESAVDSWFNSDAGAGAGTGTAGGTGAGTGAAPLKKDDPLATLMAKDRLTPEQIDEARKLIQKLPEAQRSAYWLKLQSKAEYQNQRDNRGADEKSTGGTCNLTSLAMCLEYLGIKNPHPEMQYDEALVKIAHDNKYGDITYNTTWEKVAKHCGASMVTIVIGDQKVSRNTWETKVRDQHLAAGHSVMCSIVGHIVRVQAVTENGLVVDNPYGLETIGAGTSHTWVKTNKGKNGWGAGHKENEGEDNTWPWKDVESHTFRSILAFKR